MRMREWLPIVPFSLVLLFAIGHAAAKDPPKPTSPNDPILLLETYMKQEKVEFEEQAVNFYLKLQEAGCTPEQAHRWTRMALFADRDWNLAELSGVVEEQLLAGATRQVVEGEIEQRIKGRATEMRVDLGQFPASFARKGPPPSGPAPQK